MSSYDCVLEQAGLVSWIVGNRAPNIKMRIYRIDWPNKFDCSLFDFDFLLQVDDEIYVGQGCSESESVALNKAAAEAVERLVWRKSGLSTTNGFGAHFCFDRAKQSAYKELIERHIFMSAFSNGLFGEEILPSGKILSNLEVFMSLGLEVEFNLLSSQGGLNVVLFSAFGSSVLAPRQKFGVMVGLGADSDLAVATEKSVEEVARDIAFLLTTNAIERTRVVPWGPEKHRDVCMQVDYGIFFRSFLRSGTNQKVDKALHNFSHSEISYTCFDVEKSLPACPFYVARAHSASLIDLEFGPNVRGVVHPLV